MASTNLLKKRRTLFVAMLFDALRSRTPSCTSSLCRVRLCRSLQTHGLGGLVRHASTAAIETQQHVITRALTRPLAGAVGGGGRGAACFDRLAHSFVVVAPRRATARALLGGGADASSSIIVDAGFRDALTVAFPPAALAAVLGAVPAVWVGRGERLTAAVSAVAAATRAARAAYAAIVADRSAA
jgi:hypothetical protein